MAPSWTSSVALSGSHGMLPATNPARAALSHIIPNHPRTSAPSDARSPDRVCPLNRPTEATFMGVKLESRGGVCPRPSVHGAPHPAPWPCAHTVGRSCNGWRGILLDTGNGFYSTSLRGRPKERVVTVCWECTVGVVRVKYGTIALSRPKYVTIEAPSRV